MQQLHGLACRARSPASGTSGGTSTGMLGAATGQTRSRRPAWCVACPGPRAGSGGMARHAQRPTATTTTASTTTSGEGRACPRVACPAHLHRTLKHGRGGGLQFGSSECPMPSFWPSKDAALHRCDAAQLQLPAPAYQPACWPACPSTSRFNNGRFYLLVDGETGVVRALLARCWRLSVHRAGLPTCWPARLPASASCPTAAHALSLRMPPASHSPLVQPRTCLPCLHESCRSPGS